MSMKLKITVKAKINAEPLTTHRSKVIEAAAALLEAQAQKLRDQTATGFSMKARLSSNGNTIGYDIALEC